MESCHASHWHGGICGAFEKPALPKLLRKKEAGHVHDPRRSRGDRGAGRESSKKEEGDFMTDLYRKLSEPFPDVATAEEAMNAFYEDLKSIGEKHKIADLLCGIRVGTIRDGRCVETILSLFVGDVCHAEGMAAWIHGYEAAERQKRIARMLSQAKSIK